MELTRKTGVVFWLLWHGIMLLGLVLIPGLLVFGEPAWSLSGEQTIFLAGIVFSYLTCLLILTVMSRNNRPVSLRDLLLVIFSVFGVYFLVLLLTGSYFSRPILLFAFISAALLFLMSFTFKTSIQKFLVFIAVILVSLSQLMADDIVKQLKGGIPGPQFSQKLIGTEFYNVRALIYKNLIDGCPEAAERCGPSATNGGGISTFGDGYLLATGKGDLFYLLPHADSDKLESNYLKTRIPINTDSFEADNGDTDVWLFRVTDILVQEKDSGFVLFAAYHYWDSDRRCSVLRISSTGGAYDEFLTGSGDVIWQTVYDSEPCLPVTKGRRGDRFKGADSGGRMVLLDDSRLLFSVGDYQVDGWNREEILAQNNDVPYGKTMLIDLESSTATIYSSGHRNQQGLYADDDGDIWLTEHGPRGGDELNLILEGRNYGWPLVTYGTEYGEKSWPLSQNQGKHDGYQRPVYSWVPSIAVSNVVKVENDLFPLWQGDLLVASYKESLRRLRVREGRVIYQEPIMVLKKSGRIRDLMEDKGGRIVLWLDAGAIAVLEPLDEEKAGEDNRGQVLYVQCAGCHNVKTGGGHPRDSKIPGIGPDLLGIAGRKIAGASEYSYSSALQKLSGVWSDENLSKFLKDPQAFSPGNKMEFQGIPDEADRNKVVEYLNTLK